MKGVPEDRPFGSINLKYENYLKHRHQQLPCNFVVRIFKNITKPPKKDSPQGIMGLKISGSGGDTGLNIILVFGTSKTENASIFGEVFVVVVHLYFSFVQLQSIAGVQWHFWADIPLNPLPSPIYPGNRLVVSLGG